MKIAILTLPIHSNFGYIMQLYALQTVIRKQGHEVHTIQLKDEPRTLKQKSIYFVKSFIAKYLLYRKATPFRHWPTKEQMDIIDVNTWDFINKHCQLTKYIQSIDHLKYLSSDYDAFVVGSDQVWRRRYSIDIPSFFFSFLPENKLRIAYAASFGISHNDYNGALTEQCKMLLSKFHGIGVREKEAVNICKNDFHVNAVQVLDPTFLITNDEYALLIDKNKVENVPSQPFLLLYILDPTEEKYLTAEKIAHEKGLKVLLIKPSDFGKVGSKHIDDCVYPHISTWLYAFKHASYIVTDSFHGTSFSIIFKKPFMVFNNASRGGCRITSILSICGLNERLYNSSFADSTIDYQIVNKKLSEVRSKSLQFLKYHLA